MRGEMATPKKGPRGRPGGTPPVAGWVTLGAPILPTTPWWARARGVGTAKRGYVFRRRLWLCRGSQSAHPQSCRPLLGVFREWFWDLALACTMLQTLSAQSTSQL